MTTEQDQLTGWQRALLDSLATINSFGQAPTLHYWVRDHNDNSDRFEDELTVSPGVAVLINRGYVVAVPGGGYPQYLVTPAGWMALGDKPDATMYDLWHDLLGHAAMSAAAGA